MLMPYGSKAHEFAFRLPTDDARYNILAGAVRSSKTFAMLPKLILLCQYEVDGWRVITGVSKSTIYNNILKDLFEIVGWRNYSFNRQTGKLRLLTLTGWSSERRTRQRKVYSRFHHRHRPIAMS